MAQHPTSFIRLRKALQVFLLSRKIIADSSQVPSHLFQKAALTDPKIMKHERSENVLLLSELLLDLCVHNQIGFQSWMIGCHLLWSLATCVNTLFDIDKELSFKPIKGLFISFCPYSFGIFYLTPTVQSLSLHILSASEV